MFTAFSAAFMSTFFSVQVVRVHDGDTFFVNIPRMPMVFGQEIPVRIAGIDAAEINSKRPCEKEAARKARFHLEALLMAGPVDLHCERDKYFRLLCRVIVDQTFDVADSLIFMGLARPYAGGKRKPWLCRDAKNEPEANDSSPSPSLTKP